MDPLHFLSLAKHLARSPRGQEPEACYRSALGRAYYGAFGHIRSLLLAHGFQFSGGHKEHQEVIQLLKKSSIVEVAAAGSQLDDLREQRNSADYDVAGQRVRRGPFDNWTAGLAAAQAVDICKAVDDAAQGHRSLGIS